MYLGGQGAGARGYAMAALLVALGVMAVMMTVALPVWRHQAQREKEAELVFRGEQYARAVGLYQRKMGPGSVAPSVDVLVQQKFLRKKYKDPMVPDGEFQIIPFGGAPGTPGQPGTGPGGSQPQRGGVPGAGRGMQAPGTGTSFGGGQVPGQSSGFVGGGVMGVVSKSKEASIRIYRGASFYNQWRFIYVAPQPGPGQGGRGGRGEGRGVGPGMGGPGMGGPGGGGPGGRGRGEGGRGAGPGGRGPGQGGRGPVFPFPGGGRGRGN